jgi:endonuclease/exonuclease/phosphatase family metal-dependent hydrolase
MTWTVLLWNMGMGAPSSRSDRTTWDRLSELIDEWTVDVALLNEASTSILRDADGAVYEVWGTRGRDRKRRDWSTEVLSRHGLAETRDAQAVSYRGRRPNVRFEITDYHLVTGRADDRAPPKPWRAGAASRLRGWLPHDGRPHLPARRTAASHVWGKRGVKR